MGKKRKKIRGKSRFYLYWILILAVVFLTGYKATNLFRNMVFFTIREVNIKGNKHVNNQYLQSISAHLIGSNIFKTNTDDIELSYQAVSRVKSIKCKKVFPHKLVITVKERQGMFLIKDASGDFHPIDNEKYVLDKADWYLNEDLPLISINVPKDKIVIGQKIEDPRIDRIFDVYDVLIKTNAKIIADISEFYFRNDDLYFIDQNSGCRVIFSTENLAQQISRFIFLRDNQGFERNSTIDLRFDSQIIVT